jgi:phosphotriesterase-related protein
MARMNSVETVLGTVDCKDLGQTLMHEHIFVMDCDFEANYPGRWNEAERVEDAVTKLNELATRGVSTIVDLTVLGLGRYLPRVRNIASRVNLNIIVATGLYTFDDVPMPFRYSGPGLLVDGPDQLSSLFIRDITDGIADTGVRAAILKCATDRPGVTPGVERVLRAVARAHRETGVPISTHTDAATRRGLDQQEIFMQEGVALGRVVIGHCGDTTDLDYLRRLMDAGSYIGMDRFGLTLLRSFGERISTVATLCELGYAERMVLSHDASCFGHSLELADKERLLPNWKYTHLHDDVLPALRQHGVTDEQIFTMLVSNPGEILQRKT